MGSQSEVRGDHDRVSLAAPADDGRSRRANGETGRSDRRHHANVRATLKTLERAELIEMRRGRIQVIDVDALGGRTQTRHDQAFDANHQSAAPSLGA